MNASRASRSFWLRPSAKIAYGLVWLHLTAVVAYNLADGLHDLLHWWESHWHAHAHFQGHDLRHHLANADWRPKDKPQQEPSSLPPAGKRYYHFVYLLPVFNCTLFLASAGRSAFPSALAFVLPQTHYPPPKPPPKTNP